MRHHCLVARVKQPESGALPDNLRAAEANLTRQELEVVSRWLDLLTDELPVESVWLYGSRARGDGSATSDVDLLVIVRAPNPWEHRRLANRLLRRAADDRGASFLPFSIHVWDLGYLEQRRDIRSFFLKEVERDKIVLYGES